MKTAHKTHRLAGLIVLMAAMSAGQATAAVTVTEGVPKTAAQVEQFVQSVWIEGVPYEVASRISPEVALPLLQKILADPGASPYWANAAVIVGMIGEDRGADLLVDFIMRGDAKQKLEGDQTRAKTSAVMSLGYIVNTSGSKKALDFLSSGTDPKFWSERKVAWTGSYLPGVKERNDQLATMSVLGLGLSGKPEAAKVLRSIAERKAVAPELESAVRDALWANEAIAKEGLREYYRSRVKAPERNMDATRPWEEPPVKGEIILEARPGEILKEAVPGEVIAQPNKGEVLRKLTPGTTLSEPPQQNAVEQAPPMKR